MRSIFVYIKKFFALSFVQIILGALPCFALLIQYGIASEKLKDREMEIIALSRTKELNRGHDLQKERLLGQLSSGEPDYVERELEAVQFLQPEVKKLQALIDSNPQDEKSLHRLAFLTMGGNSLRFHPQKRETRGAIQVVELVQKGEVELGQEDIKTLISKIENGEGGALFTGKNPPVLLVKEIDLVRKRNLSTGEIFLLKLDLVKWEMAGVDVQKK